MVLAWQSRISAEPQIYHSERHRDTSIYSISYSAENESNELVHANVLETLGYFHAMVVHNHLVTKDKR